MSEEQASLPDDDADDSEQASQDADAANDAIAPAPKTKAPVIEEPGVARAYDFSHPQHRLNKPLDGLIINANKVAADLGPRVDQQIHVPCSAQVISAELCKHRDLADDLLTGSCVFQLDLAPVTDKGFVTLEPSLIFALVQSFFGGTENYVFEEKARALSTTELRLASRLRDCILTALNTVWGDVLAFNVASANAIAADQFSADALNTPVVARLRYELIIANQSAFFDVVLPYDALSHLHSINANAGAAVDNSQWHAGLQRQIIGCELNVHGVLAETDITVNQLLKLQTGDFIPLGNIQTATFSTGNTPLFEAVIGASNGRVSASISHWLGQKESTAGQ